MPLFSIITPSYNRAHLLPIMILSVLRQTYTDWELIIVDDGSTDNTSDLEHIKSDPRIKYVKKENSGAAHSRNVGARHASGELIVFLDSDDEAKETWLSTVGANIDEDTGLFCLGAVKKFSSGLEVLDRPTVLKLYSKEFYVKFTAGSLFIRKKLFDKVSGYDVNLLANHHTDLFYRLMILWAEQPFKIAHSDECLVQINIHEGERIRNNWQKVKSGTLSFINKHYNFLMLYQKDFLANSYSVVAYSCFRLKCRKESLMYAAKAIKYKPTSLKNYFRYLKYFISFMYMIFSKNKV